MQDETYRSTSTPSISSRSVHVVPFDLYRHNKIPSWDEDTDALRLHKLPILQTGTCNLSQMFDDNQGLAACALCWHYTHLLPDTSGTRIAFSFLQLFYSLCVFLLRARGSFQVCLLTIRFLNLLKQLLWACFVILGVYNVKLVQITIQRIIVIISVFSESSSWWKLAV